MTTPPHTTGKKREQNPNWSIDDESIRREQATTKKDPEAGLNDADDEVLGSDRYRDEQRDRQPPYHTKHLGSTVQEGGDATKDAPAGDIPLSGGGNRKRVTSGATTKRM